MPRLIYSLIYHLLLPFILLRLVWRAKKAPAYRQRLAERFGIFEKPDFDQAPIWVHAVSVGETIAAAPLIQQLLQHYPQRPIVVTTMTPTGSARVRALFGEQVFHVYAPYDLPACVKAFLGRIQPCLLIIMETEIWPNTIHYCRLRQIPTVLANGRLSAKSAKGYRKISTLTRAMLAELSTVVAQSQDDAIRFIDLGVPPRKSRCSTKITLVPISANNRLASNPAGPPPITNTLSEGINTSVTDFRF